MHIRIAMGNENKPVAWLGGAKESPALETHQETTRSAQGLFTPGVKMLFVRSDHNRMLNTKRFKLIHF